MEAVRAVKEVERTDKTKFIHAHIVATAFQQANQPNEGAQRHTVEYYQATVNLHSSQKINCNKRIQLSASAWLLPYFLPFVVARLDSKTTDNPKQTATKVFS